MSFRSVSASARHILKTFSPPGEASTRECRAAPMVIWAGGARGSFTTLQICPSVISWFMMLMPRPCSTMDIAEKVLHSGKADLGHDAVVSKQGLYVVITAQGRHDEIVLLAILQRISGCICQRMALRQQGQHRILRQGDPLIGHALLVAEKNRCPPCGRPATRIPPARCPP